MRLYLRLNVWYETSDACVTLFSSSELISLYICAYVYEYTHTYIHLRQLTLHGVPKGHLFYHFDGSYFFVLQIITCMLLSTFSRTKKSCTFIYTCMLREYTYLYIDHCVLVQRKVARVGQVREKVGHVFMSSTTSKSPTKSTSKSAPNCGSYFPAVAGWLTIQFWHPNMCKFMVENLIFLSQCFSH